MWIRAQDGQIFNGDDVIRFHWNQQGPQLIFSMATRTIGDRPLLVLPEASAENPEVKQFSSILIGEMAVRHAVDICEIWDRVKHS